MECLNAFTLLKSVDSGKLFQTFFTLHAKRVINVFNNLPLSTDFTSVNVHVSILLD